MSQLSFPSLQSQYSESHQRLMRPFGEKPFDVPTVVQATLLPLDSIHGAVAEGLVVFSPPVNERLISQLFGGDGVFSDKQGHTRVYSFVEGTKRIVEIRSNDLHSRTRSTFDWYDFPTALNRYCPTTHGIRGSRLHAEHVAIALIRAAYLNRWEIVEQVLSEPAIKDRANASEAALRRILGDAHEFLELY